MSQVGNPIMKFYRHKNLGVKPLIERGGPATSIPAAFMCASGRHDTRLTGCLCALFEDQK